MAITTRSPPRQSPSPSPRPSGSRWLRRRGEPDDIQRRCGWPDDRTHRRGTVGGMPETILVDARGLPLYVYASDTPSASLVTGQLAALWPPVRTPTPTGTGLPGAIDDVANYEWNPGRL